MILYVQKEELMKINKKNQKKNYFITTIVLLLLLSATLVFYLWSSLSRQFGFSDYNPDTPQQNPSVSTSNNTTDPDSSPVHEKDRTFTDKNPPLTNSGQEKQKIQMTASVRLDDTTLYIRGGMNNLVSTDGRCYASITTEDNSRSEFETTILRNASTTDCKTILIPREKLSKGLLTIKLHYSSNLVEGESNAQSITNN